ncbi:hypothetical protein SmJEL517_g01960 [Synchytrium microbalum]|uniref:Importin N-terminal domain-containing protein n=1 Tax=Synchytrium microbalum TaxID=1806994 RepID=A0A507CDN5_9FUNG|nr:uncharacterized protein SmJEL517_g01960 [Synchytrium microbalum]TPX35653.1 hypothetical protein SmJEL517_g01960 [Synchytrium microbalum]
MAMVTPIGPPSTEQVLAAIQQLYQPTSDKTKQREASVWLEDFQKTASAWAVADALLRSPSVGLEAHTFAGQTFRQKIVYDLEQLPSDSRASLRDSIVSLLHTYRQAPRSLTTQLCLALADLAIQYLEWTDPVGQMMSTYGSDPEMVAVLLDFLSVLPEELFENIKIPIEKDDFKNRQDSLLTHKSKDVLSLLLVYAQTPAMTNGMKQRMFSCLCSWLRFGEVDVATIVGTPIIDYAFGALQIEELFDVAADVICEIVNRSVASNIKDTVTPSIVANSMYPRLLALHPMLDESIKEEDTEKIKTLTRIFADAGAAYVEQMMLNPQPFAGLIEANIICTAIDDLEVVRVTFPFWYHLSEMVIMEQYAAARTFLIPTYIRLTDIMIKHLKYPSDLGRWTALERDEFRDFRHVMGDVLKDCVRVVGEGPALARPHAMLKGFMLTSTQGGDQPPTLDPSIPWQSIEAPLFALRTMGTCISHTENVYLPEIMSWLPQLPSHSKVKYAAILVIGRYAEWTRLHPNYIPYQLNFISKGFDDAESTAAAAQAMKFLCESCGVLLVDYLNELHPFYNQLMTRLDRSDRRDVAEAIGHVIAAVPLARLLEVLQSFCLPVAQQLHSVAMMGRPANDPDAEVKIILAAEDQLDVLTVFFQVVKPSAEIPPNTPHPLVILLSDLWPVIKALFDNYKGTRLSEALCRLLRHAIESCKYHIAALTPQILDVLYTAYDETGLACYLWVAKACTANLGNPDTPEGRAVFAMIERMAVTTLRVLSAASPNIDSQAEAVEDFFRLLLECIDVCPILVMSSTALPTLLGLAQGCFGLTQPDPLLSVLRFIRDLLSMASARYHAHRLPLTYAKGITEMARQHGKQLVEQVWRGILFDWPRTSVSEGGSILKVLGDVVPDSIAWTRTVIESLPDVGTVAGRGALNGDVFMTKFQGAVNDEEWSPLKRVVQDFATAYRRRNLIDARSHRQR